MDLTLHIPDEAVPALKAKAIHLALQTVTPFVLDASIVLTWCFPDEEAQKAEAISERIALGNRPTVHGLLPTPQCKSRLRIKA